MKTYNRYINVYLNKINKNNKFKKGYIINNKIILTNTYSIIVLTFSTKQLKKLNELDIEFINYEEIKNDYYNNDRLTCNRLLDYIDTFKNYHFCNIADFKKENDEYYILNNNYSFDKKQIKNIQKVLNGGTIYTSNSNKQTISITGKNGYAWLLACIYR